MPLSIYVQHGAYGPTWEGRLQAPLDCKIPEMPDCIDSGQVEKSIPSDFQDHVGHDLSLCNPHAKGVEAGE